MGIALGLVLALGCGGRGPQGATNVVVVMIDTLRQDRVGAYGYAHGTTPTIDRLAAAGVRADGISPTSWTRPAVATIFTGLEPLRHQVVAKSDRIPAGAETVAERLHAAGFSTLAISTNGHVAPAWGFARGFDRFVSTWKTGLGPRPDGFEVNLALRPELDALAPPFFLYVHYLDPHLPYEPDRAADGGELPEALARLRPLGEAGIRTPTGAIDPERLAAASQLYDAEVREVDDALGELLGDLEARGLMRGTLVVVTSDHGEELGEHGGLGHGTTLYEEAIRVPLVFAGSGVGPAGALLGEFPLADLHPTLLGLLGLEVRGRRLDGRDRSAELRGGARAGPVEPLLLHTEGVVGAALAWRSGRWKLSLGQDPYRKELFDLDRDPAELRDELRPDAPAPPAFSTLASELVAAYGRAQTLALPRESTDADQELAAQIAALGYGGARVSDFANRILPRRLEPADPFAGGLRGWEQIASFRSCVAPADDPNGQLLAGWHGRGEGEDGRWSMAVATFALAAPEAGEGGRLVIEGASFAPWPQRYRVERLGGGESGEGEVAPGPVRLELPLEPDPTRSGAPWSFRLSIEPEFVPEDEGLPDARRLGLFIRSICVTAR